MKCQKCGSGEVWKAIVWELNQHRVQATLCETCTLEFVKGKQKGEFQVCAPGPREQAVLGTGQSIRMIPVPEVSLDEYVPMRL